MTEWQKLLAYFKEKFPTRRRLIVRRCKLRSGDSGFTSISGDEKTIYVTINSADPWQTQVDALVHELAHALEYDKWGAHTDRWGKLHAQVYSTWVEFNGQV